LARDRVENFLRSSLLISYSDVHTVSEANDVHGHSSQDFGVQIDRENSNVDEPNIHDSSKTNYGNAEQTE
jgi:hypothetical protein